MSLRAYREALVSEMRAGIQHSDSPYQIAILSL